MIARLLCALWLVMLPDLTLAESATLTWAPNTEPDLRGYRLYHTTTADTYTDPPVFIPVPTTIYTYALPEAGPVPRTHYFRVTAIDDAADRGQENDNESAPSKEVVKIIPALPPVVEPPVVVDPPVIVPPVVPPIMHPTPQLTVAPVSSTSLLVSLEPIDSAYRVDVRVAPSPINWGAAESSPCASFPCTLAGLSADTRYDVQAAAYTGALNVDAVFGPIAQPVSARTLPAPGLRIMQASPTEIVITAQKADCPRITTSTNGSSATVLKRTVRCEKSKK